MLSTSSTPAASTISTDFSCWIDGIMLSVYTCHHSDCAKKDDSTYRRCRCPKWLDGTLPGRTGRFRTSAKTKSWEQAELLARKYEDSALSGKGLKPAKMPTVNEAVGVFLADAEPNTSKLVSPMRIVF
jgi:hypothetical protein